MTSAVRHNSTLSTPVADVAIPGLNPVQSQVVQALAAGRSVSAAAHQANVHRSTIHNWRKTNPIFAAAVREAREDYRQILSDGLLDLAGQALQTVQQFINDPQAPPAVRLKAALAVLTRPTYPDASWNLPVRLESPVEGRVVDGIRLEKDDARAAAAVSRSAPCPCGSSLKYKRCCGLNAPPVLNSGGGGPSE